MRIDVSHNTVVSHRGATPASRVWSRIVAELADLQDASTGEPGSVVNPVYGRSYVVDTSCAAAVFATEYGRTADARWQTRAEAALRAARSGGLFSGAGEPFWNGQDWRDGGTSLTATGIAVDAYDAAARRLGQSLQANEISSVLDLVAGCRTPMNGFAHDVLEAGQTMPDVQNATASALNLLGRVASIDGARRHPVYAGVDATLSRLRGGQTTAGFWTYFYPGRRERLRKTFDRQPFRVLLGAGRFDGHEGRGDLAHHLMTLYFAAGYLASCASPVADGMLAPGWSWTRKRLIGDGSSLSMDWSGDPTPSAPQHSNARDTNAYFLILGALPRLNAVGVVDDAECGVAATALLDHIASDLLAAPGRTPCIAPAEGPPEIVGNLLPMFEQSVAWKGRLLAELIVHAGDELFALEHAHLDPT